MCLHHELEKLTDFVMSEIKNVQKVKQNLKKNSEMLVDVARAVSHQEEALLKSRDYYEKKGVLLKESDYFQNQLMRLIGLIDAFKLIHPDPTFFSRFSYLEDLRK